MKVKDVYHYLNKMNEWEKDIEISMGQKDLYTNTTELHRKSCTISTESDEKRSVVNMEIDYTLEDLLKLWDEIIEEKKKIYDLIEKKKVEKHLPDSLMSINKSYHAITNMLRSVSNMSTKSVTKRKENGYIKGTDGVGTYTYDVEVTVEPRYKSKFFLDNLDKYTKLADDNSYKVDLFNTNEDIEYEPKWSVHSKLQDLLKK